MPVFPGQLLFSCVDDDRPLTLLGVSVSIPHILYSHGLTKQWDHDQTRNIESFLETVI